MTLDRRTYYQINRREQRAKGLRRVSATLSAEEYATLCAAAKIHGERPTAHLKRAALAHLDDRVTVPPALLERMDALVAVVRGIGNNLNQLARHSNEIRAFLETEEVRQELKRLDSSIRQFVESAATPPR